MSLYNYGSFTQMGHPPPKETKKKCEVKSFAVPTFCILFAIVITAFVTWQVTKNAYTSRDPSDFDKPEAHVDDGSDVSAADLRLPTSVHPIDYNLVLKTYVPGYGYKADSKNLTYDGQVTIQLNITEPVKKITLNSLDLNYDGNKTKFYWEGDEIEIEKVEPSPQFEKVFFLLKKTVQPTTNATLRISFSGKLRTDMTGLYQTTYTTSKGEMKMAAVTQMEPVYARRMVPCFDEPAFRATWTVTVIHPTGTIALANGKEKESTGEQSKDGDFIISNFQPTPKMSSYLLAVFISEFEYNEGHTKNGVRFRVWSRPEEKNSTMYAVTAGVKCLEFYEKYYNIPFPLQKQDMVALPDFSAGAMENWGLITYRENSLLYDPKIYPGAQKRRVAVVIAHELAHQWFGNLVTLKWWNDLWLNEGFATLVEYLGTDEISDGNFRMREWFAMDALWTALDADSVASTHPMTFQIDKAMDVLDSFDSITYDKGGAVLAMIRNTMGEEHFNVGVNKYLRRHQYGNAVASDLFTALDEVVPDSVLGPNGKKLNITEFAEPWTKQLGYPLVKANRLNATHIEITQERFKILATAEEEEKYRHPKWEFKWDVPIWYQVLGTSEVQKTWMKRNEKLIIKSERPILLNAESNGFYRTGYSDRLWQEIVDTMNSSHTSITPLTRVRLIDDSFTQATAGILNYSIPLGLISYLKDEKEYMPWSATLAKIRAMLAMYGTDPEKETLQRFTLSMSEKSPAKLSIDYVSKNYKDDTTFFPVLAAQGLILNDCTMGKTECGENMAKMFSDEVLNKCAGRQLSECSDIPAPFRAEAYCQAVKKGDEQTFEKMFQWYKEERNQVEKANLMNALTCSTDIITLKKLMLDAMKKEGSVFRLQDCSYLFAKISSNDAASDAMLNFLISRWDEMLVRLNQDRSGFTRIIMSIVNTIKTKEGLDQLNTFQKTATNATHYEFRKMQEGVGVTIAWRKNNLKFVTEFVENLMTNA